MLVRAPAVVELVLISSLSGGAPIEPQASEYEPIASHELHEEPIQEEAYDDDEDPRVGHAADQEVRGSLAYEEEDNDEHADYDQRESEEALETKEEDIGEPTPPPPPPARRLVPTVPQGLPEVAGDEYEGNDGDAVPSPPQRSFPPPPVRAAVPPPPPPPVEGERTPSPEVDEEDAYAAHMQEVVSDEEEVVQQDDSEHKDYHKAALAEEDRIERHEDHDAYVPPRPPRRVSVPPPPPPQEEEEDEPAPPPPPPRRLSVPAPPLPSAHAQRASADTGHNLVEDRTDVGETQLSPGAIRPPSQTPASPRALVAAGSVAEPGTSEDDGEGELLGDSDVGKQSNFFVSTKETSLILLRQIPSIPRSTALKGQQPRRWAHKLIRSLDSCHLCLLHMLRLRHLPLRVRLLLHRGLSRRLRAR